MSYLRVTRCWYIALTQPTGKHIEGQTSASLVIDFMHIALGSNTRANLL